MCDIINGGFGFCVVVPCEIHLLSFSMFFAKKSRSVLCKSCLEVVKNRDALNKERNITRT